MIARAERQFQASPEMQAHAGVEWPTSWLAMRNARTLDAAAVVDGPDPVIFRVCPTTLEIGDHRPARQWPLTEPR